MERVCLESPGFLSWKSLNFSEPQFSHLSNANNACLIGLLIKIATMYVKHQHSVFADSRY